MWWKYYKYTNTTEIIAIKIQTSYSIICFSLNYIPKKMTMAWVCPKESWFALTATVDKKRGCAHCHQQQYSSANLTEELKVRKQSIHLFLLLGPSPWWCETQSYHIENIFLVFSRTGQKQKQYILNEVILWIMLTVETYKQSQNATAELNTTESLWKYSKQSAQKGVWKRCWSGLSEHRRLFLISYIYSKILVMALTTHLKYMSFFL